MHGRSQRPQRAVFPDFFSPDGTLGALRNLPERGLRQAGFGLGYGIDVDSIDGSLAVIEPRRRGLLVGRDGLTIAMAIATDDFLGWGSTRRFGGPSSLDNVESIPLNHYVLAEYTLEFTRFAADVIAANLGATQWKLFVAGRRLKSGSPAAYLRETWTGSPAPRVCPSLMKQPETRRDGRPRG